jgi:hypothetical protein
VPFWIDLTLPMPVVAMGSMVQGFIDAKTAAYSAIQRCKPASDFIAANFDHVELLR